ncbi:HNH endonuclease [bacterium]|nr:HNH endonuclease [bacterium]
MEATSTKLYTMNNELKVMSYRINENLSKEENLTTKNQPTKDKIRAIAFDKFGGKCAYCGVDLIKGWNVDHIKPKVLGGTNDLDNLNPSCKDCNNYKRHTDLEGYRDQLHKMLNEKLEYLFKSKTKMQVAINMGSIKHTFWDGKFYFERVGTSCR